jgi:hypothetical protein
MKEGVAGILGDWTREESGWEIRGQEQDSRERPKDKRKGT